MVRETRHLWVGNLPDSTSEDRIKEHFKRYGPVQSVKVVSSGDGVCATVAFVDICSAAKAHKAEHRLEERILKTNYYEQPSLTAINANSSHYPSSGGSHHRESSHYSSSSPVGARSPRFSTSLSEDHNSYDRSSHFYENRRDETIGYNGPGGPSGPGSLRRPYPVDREVDFGGRGGGGGRIRSYPTNRTHFLPNGRAEPGDFRWGGGQYRYHSDAYVEDKIRRSGPGSSPPPIPRMSSRNTRGTAPTGSNNKRRPPTSRSGSESPSSTRSSRSSSSGSSSSSSSRSTSSQSGRSLGRHSSRSTSRSPRRVQSTINSAICSSNTSTVIPPTEKRLFSISVKELPPWSSDNSLKDGLFHEYKKYGLVTDIRIMGTGADRVAHVYFKNQEDAEKALDASHDKDFYGVKIQVSPHQGLETAEVPKFKLKKEVDEYDLKATRTLFIGGLDKDITPKELRKHFEQFGDIIEIDIKKGGINPMNRSQNSSVFAFLQYSDILSVVQAMKTMDGEYLRGNRINLGFGKSMPNRYIWVGGISEALKEPELVEQFKRYGPIASRMIDRKKGHALIAFENESQASGAVSEMRGKMLSRKRLQIDFASKECQESFKENLTKQEFNQSNDRAWERRDIEKYDRNRRDPAFPQRPVASQRLQGYPASRNRNRYDTFEDYPSGRNYDEFADDSFERDLHEYAGRQRFENGPTAAPHANTNATPSNPTAAPRRQSFSPSRQREERSPISPRPIMKERESLSPMMYNCDDLENHKLGRHRSASDHDHDSFHSHSPPPNKLSSPRAKTVNRRPSRSPSTPVAMSPSREVTVLEDKTLPDPRRRRPADINNLVVRISDVKRPSAASPGRLKNHRLPSDFDSEDNQTVSCITRLEPQDPRLSLRRDDPVSSGDERSLDGERPSKKSKFNDGNLYEKPPIMLKRTIDLQDGRYESPNFRKPFEARKGSVSSENKFKKDGLRNSDELLRSPQIDPRHRKASHSGSGESEDVISWRNREPHYGVSSIENEFLSDASPPGTPVRDEREEPSSVEVCSRRYYPSHLAQYYQQRERVNTTPLCLPLPKWAQQSRLHHSPRLASSSPRSGSLIRSPTFTSSVSNSLSIAPSNVVNSNHVVTPGSNSWPNTTELSISIEDTVPVLADTPVSPGPAIQEDNSDSESSVVSPSGSGLDLDERIKALDEKYEKWTGATRAVGSSHNRSGGHMESTGKGKNSSICKKNLPDLDDLKSQGPSDIVKSLLSKRSVFDEDSDRLKNFSEKYEPRPVNASRSRHAPGSTSVTTVTTTVPESNHVSAVTTCNIPCATPLYELPGMRHSLRPGNAPTQVPKLFPSINQASKISRSHSSSLSPITSPTLHPPTSKLSPSPSEPEPPSGLLTTVDNTAPHPPLAQIPSSVGSRRSSSNSLESTPCPPCDIKRELKHKISESLHPNFKNSSVTSIAHSSVSTFTKTTSTTSHNEPPSLVTTQPASYNKTKISSENGRLGINSYPSAQLVKASDSSSNSHQFIEAPKNKTPVYQDKGDTPIDSNSKVASMETDSEKDFSSPQSHSEDNHKKRKHTSIDSEGEPNGKKNSNTVINLDVKMDPEVKKIKMEFTPEAEMKDLKNVYPKEHLHIKEEQEIDTPRDVKNQHLATNKENVCFLKDQVPIANSLGLSLKDSKDQMLDSREHHKIKELKDSPSQREFKVKADRKEKIQVTKEESSFDDKIFHSYKGDSKNRKNHEDRSESKDKIFEPKVEDKHKEKVDERDALSFSDKKEICDKFNKFFEKDKKTEERRERSEVKCEKDDRFDERREAKRKERDDKPREHPERRKSCEEPKARLEKKERSRDRKDHKLKERNRHRSSDGHSERSLDIKDKDKSKSKRKNHDIESSKSKDRQRHKRSEEKVRHHSGKSDSKEIQMDHDSINDHSKKLSSKLKSVSSLDSNRGDVHSPPHQKSRPHLVKSKDSIDNDFDHFNYEKLKESSHRKHDPAKHERIDESNKVRMLTNRKSFYPKKPLKHEDHEKRNSEYSSDEEPIKLKEPAKRTKQRAASNSSSSRKKVSKKAFIDSESDTIDSDSNSEPEEQPKKPTYFDVTIFDGNMYDKVKARRVRSTPSQEEKKQQELHQRFLQMVKKPKKPRNGAISESDDSSCDMKNEEKICLKRGNPCIHSSSDEDQCIQASDESDSMTPQPKHDKPRSKNLLKELNLSRNPNVSDITTDDDAVGCSTSVHNASRSESDSEPTTNRKESPNKMEYDSDVSETGTPKPPRPSLTASHTKFTKRRSSHCISCSYEGKSRQISHSASEDDEPMTKFAFDENILPSNGRTLQDCSKDKKLNQKLFGLSDDSDSNITNPSDLISTATYRKNSASSLVSEPSNTSPLASLRIPPPSYESDLEEDFRSTSPDPHIEKSDSFSLSLTNKDSDSNPKLFSDPENKRISTCKEDELVDINTDWRDSTKDTVCETSRAASDSGKGSSSGISTTSSSSGSCTEELLLLDAGSAPAFKEEIEAITTKKSKDPETKSSSRKDKKKKKKHKDKNTESKHSSSSKEWHPPTKVHSEVQCNQVSVVKEHPKVEDLSVETIKMESKDELSLKLIERKEPEITKEKLIDSEQQSKQNKVLPPLNMPLIGSEEGILPNSSDHKSKGKGAPQAIIQEDKIQSLPLKKDGIEISAKEMYEAKSEEVSVPAKPSRSTVSQEETLNAVAGLLACFNDYKDENSSQAEDEPILQSENSANIEEPVYQSEEAQKAAQILQSEMPEIERDSDDRDDWNNMSASNEAPEESKEVSLSGNSTPKETEPHIIEPDPPEPSSTEHKKPVPITEELSHFPDSPSSVQSEPPLQIDEDQQPETSHAADKSDCQKTSLDINVEDDTSIRSFSSETSQRAEASNSKDDSVFDSDLSFKSNTSTMISNDEVQNSTDDTLFEQESSEKSKIPIMGSPKTEHFIGDSKMQKVSEYGSPNLNAKSKENDVKMQKLEDEEDDKGKLQQNISEEKVLNLASPLKMETSKTVEVKNESIASELEGLEKSNLVDSAEHSKQTVEPEIKFENMQDTWAASENKIPIPLESDDQNKEANDDDLKDPAEQDIIDDSSAIGISKRGRARGRGRRGGHRACESSSLDSLRTISTRSSINTRSTRSRGRCRSNRNSESDTMLDHGTMTAPTVEALRRSTRTKRPIKHPDMVEHEETTNRRKRSVRGGKFLTDEHSSRSGNSVTDVYDFHGSDEEISGSNGKKGKKDSKVSPIKSPAKSEEPSELSDSSKRKSQRIKEKSGDSTDAEMEAENSQLPTLLHSKGNERDKEDEEDSENKSSTPEKSISDQEESCKIIPSIETTRSQVVVEASLSTPTLTSSSPSSIHPQPAKAIIIPCSNYVQTPSSKVIASTGEQAKPSLIVTSVYPNSSSIPVKLAFVSSSVQNLPKIATEIPKPMISHAPKSELPNTPLLAVSTNTGTLASIKKEVPSIVQPAIISAHPPLLSTANFKELPTSPITPVIPVHSNPSFLPNAASSPVDKKDKSDAPSTPLVDPVTGHLTPMTISDDGLYIPVPYGTMPPSNRAAFDGRVHAPGTPGLQSKVLQVLPSNITVTAVPSSNVAATTNVTTTINTPVMSITRSTINPSGKGVSVTSLPRGGEVSVELVPRPRLPHPPYASSNIHLSSHSVGIPVSKSLPETSIVHQIVVSSNPTTVNTTPVCIGINPNLTNKGVTTITPIRPSLPPSPFVHSKAQQTKVINAIQTTTVSCIKATNLPKGIVASPHPMSRPSVPGSEFLVLTNQAHGVPARPLVPTSMKVPLPNQIEIRPSDIKKDHTVFIDPAEYNNPRYDPRFREQAVVDMKRLRTSPSISPGRLPPPPHEPDNLHIPAAQSSYDMHHVAGANNINRHGGRGVGVVGALPSNPAKGNVAYFPAREFPPSDTQKKGTPPQALPHQGLIQPPYITSPPLSTPPSAHTPPPAHQTNNLQRDPQKQLNPLYPRGPYLVPEPRQAYGGEKIATIIPAMPIDLKCNPNDKTSEEKDQRSNPQQQQLLHPEYMARPPTVLTPQSQSSPHHMPSPHYERGSDSPKLPINTYNRRYPYDPNLYPSNRPGTPVLDHEGLPRSPAPHPYQALPPGADPHHQGRIGGPPYSAQGENLHLHLLQNYHVMWEGALCLKNDQASVKMHFISGNIDVARGALPGDTNLIKISQRMRLEQSQLEGVARRMQMEGEYCVLMALPFGQTDYEYIKQHVSLENNFIKYLGEKRAAGIANVSAPGSQHAAYVIHIFPPCEFASENLLRIAPELLQGLASTPRLFVVIAVC